MPALYFTDRHLTERESVIRNRGKKNFFVFTVKVPFAHPIINTRFFCRDGDCSVRVKAPRDHHRFALFPIASRPHRYLRVVASHAWNSRHHCHNSSRRVPFKESLWYHRSSPVTIRSRRHPPRTIAVPIFAPSVPPQMNYPRDFY